MFTERILPVLCKATAGMPQVTAHKKPIMLATCRERILPILCKATADMPHRWPT